MASAPEPSTSEAPEERDNSEVAEEEARSAIPERVVYPGQDGRPMSRIWVAVSDKVPTVQFGNVVLTVGAERWIDDLGDGIEGRQHRIDRKRELMKDCEFAVGVERRLLQWAVDPQSKIASPVTGANAFSAPPEGYDSTKVVEPGALSTPAPEQSAQSGAQPAAAPADGTPPAATLG